MVSVCVYIIKAEEWRGKKEKKKKEAQRNKEPLYDDQIIKKIKRTTKTKYKISISIYNHHLTKVVPKNVTIIFLFK